MTKEQEEAIERLEKRIKDNKDYKTTQVWLTDDVSAVYTVLNMLKEKDAEIEQKNTELAEKSAEIEKKDKKDKIIDLMAERIEWLCKSNGILLDKEHDENFTQQDIKQYFERKMKMEIEVGEYVRTNTGKFDKAINNNYYMPQYIECEKSIVNKENIAKHSKNIIDLIEVGDYVNGYKVTDKYLFAGEMPVIETEGNDTNCKCLCEKDIKTILTHEQFEANCYTVERKEEC